MRVLRAKLIRKHLKFYRIVFGFNHPYHVILDGNFIHNALVYKLDIRERLQRLLQGAEVKYYILKSVVDELRSVGKKTAAALEFAEQFCQIVDDSGMIGLPGERLLTLLERQLEEHSRPSSAAGRASRRLYMVATQDKDLRSTLAHRVAGVPLIYLNKVIMVLEPPSEKSRNFNRQTEQRKVTLSAEEAAEISGTQTTSDEKARQASAASKGAVTVAVDGGRKHVKVLSITGTDLTSRQLKRRAGGFGGSGGSGAEAPRNPNPLASKPAVPDSKNTKKKQQNKFRSASKR